MRPSSASCRSRSLEVHALARVGAVQRLVEHEYLRVVHQGRRQPHALPHAARVRIHRAVLRVGQVHQRDRAIDRLLEVGHAAQLAHHRARTRGRS